MADTGGDGGVVPIDVSVGAIADDLAVVADNLDVVTGDLAALRERLVTVEQSVDALVVPLPEVHWKVHTRGLAS